MNPEMEHDDNLVNSLLREDESVRVTMESARHFLLKNKRRVVNGNVRYYQIKHIGLEVYEVRLLPVGKKATVLVEVWKTEENSL